MRWLPSLVAGALLLLSPRIVHAQFVVEGIVHDSRTLAPTSDVVVFILDDLTGLPLSPGFLGDPAQQGQITGADGRYRIDLQPGLQVRLSLERPDARFVFPSVLSPPDGIACSEVSCEGGVVSTSPLPTRDGIYAIRFATTPLRSAGNNHIPIDPLGELVRFELTSDRDRANRGEHVVYTARIQSMAVDPIGDVELSVVLPGALRFLAGTENGAVVEQNGSSTPLAVELRQSDLQLRVPVPVDPGRTVIIRFATKVAAPFREPRVVTRAALERGGGIVLAEASAELTLSGDPNLEQAMILGRVFCDRDGGRAGWQDSGEPGLYATRIYLDTGFWVESDAAGLFSFTGVPPGVRLLKLDEGSLPPGSRPLSPIRAQLYLSPGTPGKVSFAIDCRFETWSKPSRIEVSTRKKEKEAPAPEEPPATRTVRLAIDATSRTVEIADQVERMLEAELQAELRDGTLRLHPRAAGPFTPTRWRIHLFEVDPDGKPVRAFNDEALTGPGPPPLFLDFAPGPLPAGHGYRARLELRAEEMDQARSPPVDVVAPAPRAQGEDRLLGRVEAATLDTGLAALRESVPPGEQRISIEAHWDGAEGPEAAHANAEALGRRAKERLLALGVAPERIDVVSRGAEAPLFPSIVARLRERNRRVEIFLRSAPVIRAPPQERPKPQSVDITISGRTATIPMSDRSQVELTIDLDVPAQIRLDYHDGRGGESTLRRSIDHARVSRSGRRQAVAPSVDPEKRSLELGLVSVPLPPELLRVDGVRLTSEGLELSLAERGGIERWSVEVRDPRSGRVVTRASGEGEPPARMELAFTSTAATELRASAEYSGKERFEPLAIPLPPWSPAPKQIVLSGRALADPRSALAELLELELESPAAKVAVRIDGGTAPQRERIMEALRDLEVIEEAPERLEGELSLTARLLYDERVDLPPPREPGEVAAYGVPPVAPDLDVEVSGRQIAIQEPLGLLLVPLPELETLPPAKSTGEPDEPEEEVDPSTLPAAQVELTVPEAGATLERASLPVIGRTVAGNTILINGEAVAVDPDGGFAHTVALDPGTNDVRVESLDPDGNLAVFERRVETSSIAWFLMAMADGSVSTGAARLAGSNDDTRVELGPLSLDGRVLAYGKARFAFSGIIEQLELTGRIDTAEQADSTVLRLSDDPLRLLPAFGDASLEVQDGASRHKVYLDVVADGSRVTLGNSSTALSPFGDESFFSFRRSGFGVHASLAESFAGWDDTRIAGTYAFENEGIRRGHDELQGTGGTMFWLSNDELVEGSERVRLVVRDRDTGMVLTSIEQSEGQHYEIRPREGRIVFRQPVPHVAGVATLAMNRSVALTGHPLYVVVDYEYLASGADERSWGVEVRETLFSQVELYFGAAGEDRIGGDHRVFAGAAAWRPLAGTYLELEYARSSGETGLGALSVDGGLSYRPLDRPLSDTAAARLAQLEEPFFNALDKEAISLSGHLDFGDLTDDPDGIRGFVHAYGRKAGLMFSSLSVGREQGRLAGGIAASVGITKEITARGSFDAAFAILPGLIDQLPTAASVPGVLTMLAVVGADYRDRENGATLEVAHLRGALRPDGAFVASTGVAARYERRVTKELSLGIAQDALFGNDRLTGEGLGRFATTAFGSIHLTDRLQLSLAESVRWNGDNATQLGLRFEGEDGLVVYVAERFSESGSEPRLTTVIGTEDEVAEGSRTYGELQMDSLHTERMQAVIGMDNRWRVAEGLDLMLAYERAHLIAGDLFAPGQEPLPELSPFEAPFGGTSATLGGFGTGARFLSGNTVSRDAIAAGISWTGARKLDLSQRFELRIDDAPEGASDFLIIGSHTGAAVQLHRDISMLGRLTLQHARDTTNDRIYARALEGSVAAVYRPRFEDWFTLVARYSKLILQRPESVDPERRVVDRDAFSAEPIIDTPWNVQLVERVAFVRNSLSQEGLPPLSGWLLLWVNRLNARFIEVLEAGVEYRMLLDLEADTTESGFLVEAGYLPVEYVRIGAGYNFTRFSDDVLGLADRDASGPFLRVTARY